MSPLTVAYRDALAGISSGTLARIAAAWLRLYDPARPLWSAARIAEAVAPWIEGGQLAAADLTTLYLAALTAEAAGLPLEAIGPYRVPAGLVGRSAAGATIADLAGFAPITLWLRLKAGAGLGDAALAAAAWLGRVGASEPYRAANETITRNAVDDDRLTGRVNRITRPGACAFCVLIHDRGYLPAHAGFPAHAHCRCTAEPEISSYVYSESARRRAARALAELGDSHDMTTPTAPTAPTTEPPAPPPPSTAPPAPPEPTAAEAELAKVRAVLAEEQRQRKAAEGKLDRLTKEGMTEQERLIAEAKAAGKAEAAAEHARELAAARFAAVAAGRLANPDKALARLDLDKLVKDGRPDEAAIASAVDDLAAVPAPPGHVPPGPRSTAPPGDGDFLRAAINAAR